jgi:TRAP-type C4-dicarboxylate transport system substrate-binding protein
MTAMRRTFAALRPHRTAASAVAGAAVLALCACSGSVGAGGGTADGGAGEGFEYGAPQDEVDAIVEELEPVTLKFQPAATSATSVMAPAGSVLAELIEERSNGKIEVEVVWGQAIAGYDTVHDALADGRLDLAYTLPIYQPTEFPAFNDLATTTALLPSSPFVGELLPYAVYNDLGWRNEEVVAGFEERGLTPLTPFFPTAGYYTACTEPVVTAEDWKGRQTRIGSVAQDTMIREVGGSPVSMEYTETYEALQRGSADCNLGPTAATAEGGLLEVAPHLGYTTDYSFPRAGASFLAGSGFDGLPLAYQQIIFDSNSLAAEGVVRSYTDGAAAMIGEAKAHGGEVSAFDGELQSRMGEISRGLTDEAVAGGAPRREHRAGHRGGGGLLDGAARRAGVRGRRKHRGLRHVVRR